jgi:hypothetical protein
MATGAAGAMPYFAGISALDTLGLCDEYVARYGRDNGNRPGHQREAPEAYVLAKSPTFMFREDSIHESFDPAKDMPHRDEGWEAKGYIWVVAKVTPERYGAPRVLYHYFRMRLDRATDLAGDPDTITALGMPN